MIEYVNTKTNAHFSAESEIIADHIVAVKKTKKKKVKEEADKKENNG